MSHKNRLASEHSPYLLQHANNPVDWYAWGEEAFTAARAADLPIFLSIGYSTCYWCHVMEHDSFEQAEVAEALKGRFIAIKVDREERPDVDSIYMDAVVGLTGHGGWPMSVFLTPELKPFWGGTYFPRAQFLKILDALSTAWINDRARVSAAAKQITTALSDRSDRNFTAAITPSIFDKAAANLNDNFDAEFGGFGAAPKFPPAEQCRFLMRHGWLTNRPEWISMATRTLDAMSRGGIYDHIGGGFSRYSVDKYWLVPHFEKMLYDNALLVPAYLEAYQLTKQQQFADIARETIDYVLRDLVSPQGGFFAAEDAGEVGREGEFYVWTYDQLAKLLDPSELSALSANTLISASGNFEHGANVLALKPNADWSVRSDAFIRSAFNKLRTARSERTRPHLDHKIITAWNGLLITALASAARVLQDSRYGTAAGRALDFIRSVIFKNDQLLRSHSSGVSAHPGCLEDYAALIEACLAVYQLRGDEATLNFAHDLQTLQDKYFWVTERNLYRFSRAAELPVAQFDRIDGATPSGNSISLKNLAILELLAPARSYSTRRRALAASMAGLVAMYPHAACRALEGYAFEFEKPVIVGLPIHAPNLAAEIQSELVSFYISPLVISWIDSDKAHICHGVVCSQPTGESTEILGLIRGIVD